MRVAILLACSAACATEPQEKAGAPADAVQTVTVSRTRDPVEKSYRKMLQGMDLFEKMHSMAPTASLRYKLLPRQRDTNMDGIVLRIVGDSVTIPVPVASDHMFTLERNQQALDEDASVMPNRKANSMTWRTEIRTPGLLPNTRRLGDLRLECHVGLEADLISNYVPVIGRVANFLQRMLDYCNGSEVHYLFFSERPLFGVALVSCDCQVLLDRTFFLPLGDRSWPDDTRIEFEYMDDENAHQRAAAIPAQDAGDAITIGNSTKADVVAALGKAAVISFDSGFEVWVYRYAGDTPAKAGAVERNERAGSGNATPGLSEFVLLFAPSGIVAKTRIRPAPPRGGAKGR